MNCFNHTKLFTTLVLLLTCAFQALAAKVGQDPAPSEDAAVWYLTAAQDFVTYQEQVDLLHGRDDLPKDDQSKRKAIEELSYTLWLIRRGASMDSCHWAFDLKEQGPEARLPHLHILRQQADLLQDIAWFNASQKDGQDQAISDCIAMLRMSRHASCDGTLIGCLIQNAIEDDAYSTLSFNLHYFDRAQLERIQKELNELSPRRTIGESVVAERHLVGWMRDRLIQHGVQGLKEAISGDESLIEVLDLALKDKTPEQQLEQLKRWLDEMEEMYTKYMLMLSIAYPGFTKQNTQFIHDLEQSENPLAKQFIPVLGNARLNQEQIYIGHEILRAMLAFRLSGQAAFDEITDPTDGKPFNMLKQENWLSIESRLINRHGVAVRQLFDLSMEKPLNP